MRSWLFGVYIEGIMMVKRIVIRFMTAGLIGAAGIMGLAVAPASASTSTAQVGTVHPDGYIYYVYVTGYGTTIPLARGNAESQLPIGCAGVSWGSPYTENGYWYIQLEGRCDN
jgi:hypothetical protein